jgi:hypothetical protein
MNLRKALLEKNKLSGKINQLQQRLRENNICEDGQQLPYNSREVLQEIHQCTEQLIALKVKIQIANTPILADIYELAELKSLITRLRYIDCNDTRRISSGIITYQYATIKAGERDLLVQDIEAKIEAIQERIDSFNFRTEL